MEVGVNAGRLFYTSFTGEKQSEYSESFYPYFPYFTNEDEKVTLKNMEC